MIERRKLNDVYAVPCAPGLVNVVGVIGSGKYKEVVSIKKKIGIADSKRVMVDWRHRMGELWRLYAEEAE